MELNNNYYYPHQQEKINTKLKMNLKDHLPKFPQKERRIDLRRLFWK